MGTAIDNEPALRGRHHGAVRCARVLWIGALLAPLLSACTPPVGSPVPGRPGTTSPVSGSPDGPPINPNGTYNPDTRWCGNFRAYHRDCRRKDQGDDQQPQESNQGGRHAADPPAAVTRAA